MTVRARSGLGELRSRIKLVKATRTPSGDLAFDEKLDLIGEIWANAMEMAPNGYQGDSVSDPGSPITMQFRVRARPGLDLPDVTVLVMYAGRRYRLMRTRRDDQRGDYMILYCSPKERVEVGPGPGQAPSGENWQ